MIRKKHRGKIKVFLLCMAVGLIFQGCSKDIPVSNETISEDVSIEKVDTKTPIIEYDLRSETMSVKDTTDYSLVVFPDEVKKARLLDVEDDDFTLNAYVPLLISEDYDIAAELPKILDRTDKSLHYIRDYIQKKAPSVYPQNLAQKRVDIKIGENKYGYLVDEDRIEIEYNDIGSHREFLYLMALMNRDVGWEQFGYAWYAGTCDNPYCEISALVHLDSDYPYYKLCENAGVDMTDIRPENLRIIYDAASYISLEKGLCHWGSPCESMPVTIEIGYSGEITDEVDEADEYMSAFMAASFLGWLDDTYGFEKVSQFCFGQKNFSEAFEVNFNNALSEWKTYISQEFDKRAE